jgi:prepilin-type processing-associated H-X9-DG protein
MLLLFVILWSALAAFEGVGIIVTIVVVGLAVSIHAGQKLTWKDYFVIVLMLSALLRSMRSATPPGPESAKSHCCARLRQIAQGLLAYHNRYGSFPAAYAVDTAGKPMCSWRARVLPYFGHLNLYRQYDFNAPWNDPKNAALSLAQRRRREHGTGFACPSDPSWDRDNAVSDFTSYFAVVGPQAAWRGSTAVKLSDLPHGGERMILLVESADRAVNWKEPKDLSYEEASAGVNRRGEPCIASTHAQRGDYFHHPRRGAYAAFADGHVHFLPEDIPREDLQALLTGDTTRQIDLASLARPTIHWSHIVGLSILIASSGLLLIGTIVQRRRRPAESETTEEINNPQRPPTTEAQ